MELPQKLQPNQVYGEINNSMWELSNRKGGVEMDLWCILMECSFFLPDMTYLVTILLELGLRAMAIMAIRSSLAL